MRCSQVADSLAEVASGTLSIDGQHARHVASCLRCQAELASYRKLFHGLPGEGLPFLDPSLVGAYPGQRALAEGASEPATDSRVLSVWLRLIPVLLGTDRPRQERVVAEHASLLKARLAVPPPPGLKLLEPGKN